MSIICVYVFPVAAGRHYEDACRFVASYNANPALADHELVIVSNGGPPTIEMRALLDQLNHDYRVIQSDNRAYDISGFQDAAKSCPCWMMVFMGTTAYLRRPGWLNRMQDSFTRYGNAAIYGSTANQRDNRANVFPHIRTTRFWMSP